MNVLDHLKSQSVEAIKNYCADNCVNAAVAMTHSKNDFNLSSMGRAANFFGFKEVYYIEGKRGFDRRGCVGTHNYTPFKYCQSKEDFWNQIKDKYVPIAVENNVNYSLFNVFEFEFPLNPIFIFGEEMEGLSDDVLVKCEKIITIPVFGSVRSLNVASCAAVIMALYRKQLDYNGIND